MRLTTFVGLSISCLSVPPGCHVAPGDEDGEWAAADAAMEVGNAIVPNAIVPNAIVPNAIVPNAIVQSALALEALDAASREAILDPGQRGALSRMFLRYTVGCALAPSQSLSFEWTDAAGDAHTETYVGLVGLATSWASEPLTNVGRQRLVSACLAARTNYSGVSVEISIRSYKAPLRGEVTEDEIDAYPNVEGAFWGNLFTATPALYSCFVSANVASSRAASRECATGHVTPEGDTMGCGPITLGGPCDALCAGFRERFGFALCRPPGEEASLTVEVITTALR